MRVLPVRQVGRVYQAIREMSTVSPHKILQQRLPKERLGVSQALVCGCKLVGDAVYSGRGFDSFTYITQSSYHRGAARSYLCRILQGASAHRFIIFWRILHNLMSDTTGYHAFYPSFRQAPDCMNGFWWIPCIGVGHGSWRIRESDELYHIFRGDYYQADKCELS
jgi:hypothetical protein